MQNTPALWKHTCNCGAAEMVVQDAHSNSYVFTDASLDTSRIIKISPNGAEKFKKSFFPSGFYAHYFTNSFYKDGMIYIAGYADSTGSPFRMFLMRIDTMGNLINRVFVDTISSNTITGIKSAPFYSYGFFNDQYGNIHTGSVYYSPTWVKHFQFRKFDSALNQIAQFTDTLSFSAVPGTFFVRKDGTVFYGTAGSLKKLDPSYNSITWSYSLPQYDNTNMIYADNQNNIWGIQSGYTTGYTFSLYKLTDAGSTYQFNYSQPLLISPSTTDFNHMIVDSLTNSVYLAGAENGGLPYVRHIYKVDAFTGMKQWEDTLYGNYFVDLKTDSVGRLLAVGGGENYYVWYYSLSGNLAYTFIYDAPFGCNDAIKSAVLENNNRLVVTGSACENANTINWATTLKYIVPNITTSVDELSHVKSLEIYPVPVREKLYLKNLNEAVISAFITDLKGSVNKIEFKPDNSINTSDLVPGIYTLEIKTASYRMRTTFIRID